MTNLQPAFVLLYLALGIGIASCNLGAKLGIRLQDETDASAILAHTLDHVPRIFEIDQLQKLQSVPETFGQAGKVIGMVTKNRSIVSVNEAILHEILHPLIVAHIPKVAQHIPQIKLGSSDFSIAGSSFQLSPQGDLSLAVDVVIAGEIRHTGYLQVRLSDTATDRGERYIVLPPNHSLGSCIRNDCKDGLCRFNSASGCLCHRNALDVRGCLTIW